jgi:hypothetical protein
LKRNLITKIALLVTSISPPLLALGHNVGGVVDGTAADAALAQAERMTSMLDPHAPGCVVKGPDGKPLPLAGKSGDVIRVPRGTTFSAACLVERGK